MRLTLAIAVRGFWLNARERPEGRDQNERAQNQWNWFWEYLMNPKGSEVRQGSRA